MAICSVAASGVRRPAPVLSFRPSDRRRTSETSTAARPRSMARGENGVTERASTYWYSVA